MLLHGFDKRIGINDATAHTSRFGRYPAVRSMFLVLLQNKFAALTLVEVPKFRIPSLHLLEKMQYGLSLVRKIHFRVQVHIDVKVITQ